MPDITVHRHGDRWAVADPDAEGPRKEFPSREAAELAARQLAAGGTVHVVQDDPTGLADVQDPDAGEADAGGADTLDGLRDHERVRTEQGGL